ncbi:TlpA family protein disulfide reductase [Hazenella sp. IB182357]|uniref:TlpA family protein disulfide reductase n=1 Tax=Polycladospora coralii TaxID=2771432 RepID=A0A926RSZ0_9BACL|nr:TlpA disulfide reductase family protein [Polycladospora coralii]MBD1370978.1 TlpA family protein disulfide reductase [Polycladospora coralii]MBS7529917.1 TlpA family protein disulfide reductase [Polycladospora coralii]
MIVFDYNSKRNEPQIIYKDMDHAYQLNEPPSDKENGGFCHEKNRCDSIVIDDNQYMSGDARVKMIRTMAYLVLFAGLLGIGWLNIYKENDTSDPISMAEYLAEQQQEWQGTKAPAFTLPTLTGEQVSFDSTSSKPTIINFWTTWCAECKKEMPVFEKLYQEYGADIDFMMVNMTAEDNREQIDKYLKENRLTFPVLLDEQAKMKNAYDIPAYPTTYVIDQDNEIIALRIGALEESQLRNQIQQLLN